jgi:hypothetical protein
MGKWHKLWPMNHGWIFNRQTMGNK